MSMTHERTVLKSESLQQQLVELQAFVHAAVQGGTLFRFGTPSRRNRAVSWRK